MRFNPFYSPWHCSTMNRTAPLTIGRDIGIHTIRSLNEDPEETYTRVLIKRTPYRRANYYDVIFRKRVARSAP